MAETSKFPVRRLRDAGATPQEITALQIEFARSDEVYQRDFANSFLGKSKVEVLIWLQDARENLVISDEALQATEVPENQTPDRQARAEKTNAVIVTGDEGDTEGDQ